MSRFIKSVLFYFILLLLLSYPVELYISKNFSTYNKQSWILKKQGLSLDYAVLGSSRVANMIDIKSLNTSYGKKGINIGTSGSAYAENYVILSEFISKNKITTLLLNADEFCFNSENSYNHPFHEYEFLPLFDKYQAVFHDFIPDWKFYFWKILPAFKYIEFNKQFTVKKTRADANDKSMGSNLIDEAGEADKLVYKRKQTELKEIDKNYFLKIINLCRSANIKVILITTPVYAANKEKRTENFRNYVDSISQSMKIPYYSYKSFFDYTNISYFKDNTHTNAKGSIRYSAELGLELKKNNE